MTGELVIRNARLRAAARERAGLPPESNTLVDIWISGGRIDRVVEAGRGRSAGNAPGGGPSGADTSSAPGQPSPERTGPAGPEASAGPEQPGSDRAAGPAGTSSASGRGAPGAAGPPHATEDLTEIDAAGGLVTESFVNGHLHLDKVYTLSRVGTEALGAYHGEGMGNAMSAIEIASRVKDEYDETWITENVRGAVELAVRYGNTHIRAFADVDTKAKLEGVRALLRVKEECKNRCDLQVVAFPQDGVLRDPGAEEWVREALVLGADCVGGIPWIEYTDDDAREHIDRMFTLAEEFDRDVSMLVDDAGDPGLRTTEMLAVRILRAGWQGRVTAQHARAMSLYPDPYFRKLTALLSQAGMSVVSDPHTGPLHARVRDLRNAGIPVALGQDDIADAYYPFGRNNMLEVGFLASHLLWMTSFDQLDAVYDMITTDAARALGMSDFALAPGNEANLVVHATDSVWRALREHDAPRWVLKRGNVV